MNIPSFSKATLFVILLLGVVGEVLADAPSDVVREYIVSFKERNKQKMLSSLHDQFFAEYKKQYLAKVESYPDEKRKALLAIYEVSSIDSLKAMSGKEILSTFLDKPVSRSYWSGFDSVELQIEVSTTRVEASTATVTSLIRNKTNPSMHVETNYELVMERENWKIVRFAKKIIRQNQQPEASTSTRSAAPEIRKAKNPAIESATPSAEALERKERSIQFLKQKGVPTMEGLPAIEDSATSKIRPSKQIAERLIGCMICAVGGETGDKKLASQMINEFSAELILTPKEEKFLATGIDARQERIQFSWRYERIWVLLWALGYIERLDYPPAICDMPKLVRLLKGKSVEQLIKEAKPRSQKELLDEADLIYRLNWAVVDERVNKKVSVPKEVEKGVVLERHAALNWLIGYLDQDWDEISTDT